VLTFFTDNKSWIFGGSNSLNSVCVPLLHREIERQNCCIRRILLLLFFSIKLFWKFYVKSHDATRFYYGHAGYSIEVSPPSQPALPNTHKHNKWHTHTARAIRSVPSIIQSNFPELFHLQRTIHSDLCNVSTWQDHIYILSFVLHRHSAASDNYFVGKIIQFTQ
jgi:hypothetical protein